LTDDLHLNAADMAELVEKMAGSGLPAEKIELEEVDTVESLVDQLAVEEDL